MCGIAGVLKIHAPGAEVPPHRDAIPECWIDTLDASIAHRGPDGRGRFRDRSRRPDGQVIDVALAHRRLSIIDLDGGAQPMVHVRGEGLLTGDEFDATDRPAETDLVAVAFNGCIYNHRELRAQLEACGHVFETDHSDTEVLVHGWREWRIGLHERLDGMYACLIWDRATGTLVEGRDRAGEKPLYRDEVGLTDSTVVFASAPPGMLPVGLAARRDENAEGIRLWKKGVSIWARDGYAEFGLAIPQVQIWPGSWEEYPHTPDENTFSPEPLPLDERLRRARAQQRDLERFCWSAPSRSDSRVPLDFESAVNSRLEADVPLGVFLSGGIDSALIAAIAHRSRPDIKAFTVRMPEPEFDESTEAAETARAIGIEHVVLDCEPNPADDVIHLIEQLGLPFGDSSLLPTYWVSKAAREHVKVALSGDGGDELFGGYRRHAINTHLNQRRVLLRRIPDAELDRRRPGSKATYLARLGVAARHRGYGELLAIFPTPDLRKLMPNADLEETFHAVDDPLFFDFTSYLPDDLLRKTDTASMAVGLEVRAPFLARDLLESALRTPLGVLMPRGERKGLLKQVAREYLPNHIVSRPKRGFAIPVGHWFRTDYGGLRQLLHDHLLSTEPFPGLAEAGVELDITFVRQLLREHDDAGEYSINPWRGRDHSQRLYMLLVLSIWCRWLERIKRAATPK